MPVDSMTTVRTWQVVNQLAKVMRSAVQAPKERTCGGRLRGWSGGRRGGVGGRNRNPVDRGVDVDAGGVRVHHPQARLWARLAFVFLIAGCHSGLHKGKGEPTRGRERRRVGHGRSFSTGDTRQRATKDVLALSWDQVNFRARSTTRCTVTATRSLDRPL